jgi:pyruvate formate lyase activating enzyme
MSECGAVRGVVFNIQHYSIHDGPGIRSTVFLKGCPLRCLWCQNPESQEAVPEVLFVAEKCEGCGACIAACPAGAIGLQEGRARTYRARCTGAGRCAEACPHEARSLMGKRMSAEAVLEDVMADAVFYQGSGGGITLSGGDPLAQPDFAAAICLLAKEVGLHTALDTSGYAPWPVLERVLAHVDMILYDFKCMHDEKHKRFTGVSNRPILANAKRVREQFPHVAFLARFAVIPGYNDDGDNVRQTAAFLRGLGRVAAVHLLPYHNFGEAKYERLERSREPLAIEPLDGERMEEIRAVFEDAGVEAVIGG